MQRVAIAWLALAVALSGCGTQSGSPLNDRPSPPCPDDGNWTTHPFEGICAYGHEPYNEWCTAWFNVEAKETVSCDFISVDGKANLHAITSGSGSSDITVSAGDGVVAWNEVIPQGINDEWAIQGSPGRWTLTVQFDASGHATIEIWG